MDDIVTCISFTFIDHNHKERSFKCDARGAFTEFQLEQAGEAIGLPLSHMILQIYEKSSDQLKQQISSKLLEVYNKDV
jgi:hypothetical protein